jgi:hypothetical protein
VAGSVGLCQVLLRVSIPQQHTTPDPDLVRAPVGIPESMPIGEAAEGPRVVVDAHDSAPELFCHVLADALIDQDILVGEADPAPAPIVRVLSRGNRIAQAWTPAMPGRERHEIERFGFGSDR